MTIYSVFDPEFASYGRVITGYEAECKAVVEALNISTPLPEGTARWAGATVTTPS